MAKVPGFTLPMRRWAHLRDGHRCSFFTFKNGIWNQCGNTKGLDVHHLVPRGYYSQHFRRDWDLNGPDNCLTLCSEHHRGFNTSIPDRLVIHPDTRVALREYRKGDKGAFKKMMDVRYELCRNGETYWNTTHDLVLKHLVMRRNLVFLAENPYPYRKNPNYLDG